LLLAQTRAPGFDPAAQGAAIETLRRHFAELPEGDAAQLTISGPGYFAVEVAATTRDEAERLSAIGVLGFALLLLLAYRSFGALAVVALPLVAGALGGLAAILIAFGAVHGITLAFGFTLLGVAQEYPIRLFSHRRAGVTVAQSTAEVWPLLRLAIVSACIAYLALFASGVPGLQQLAVFTISGLLIAGAATRWLLPAVVPPVFADIAAASWLERWRGHLARMPRPRGLPWLVLVGALAALWIAPAPLWQNDLAELAPVPAVQLQREGELRAALGAPDVRYLLVLEADSADGVLALSEAITPQAEQWILAGTVDDVELPTRYLPSLATQRARQEKLPDRAILTAVLDTALAERDFQPDLFAPFIDDVETARSLPLLTPEAFLRSPFGARLQAMLVQRGGRWFGLAAVSGVHDARSLAQAVRATRGDDVRLLDLKTSSEALVADYRQRILVALGAALVLLAVAVAVALRDPRRAWRVIAPMSLATLAVLAVLRLCGVSLSLFHLVALTLAAGLGLHYALFFERPVVDAAEARRTLHATGVCVISAVLVFGLLATSALPVLRAIGVTVALGVAFHFCLSIQMAQRSGHAG
jgi:predicted exporter